MGDDAPGGGRGQTRILIVPDDLLTWEVRESFLDRRTFAVRTAHSPGEAVTIAQAWRPTLVLFRSELDGQTATAFCAEMRRLLEHEGVRMVMFTDQVGAPIDDAIEAQVDGHLISPIDEEQLYDTIASIMAVPRRRSPRVGIDVLVETAEFEGAEPGLANSINLSEEGILLEANGHLPVGKAGVLRFFLPGSPKRISLKAEVRVAVDEVRLHYALQFVDLSPGHRALIRQYVSRMGGLR